MLKVFDYKKYKQSYSQGLQTSQEGISSLGEGKYKCGYKQVVKGGAHVILAGQDALSRTTLMNEKIHIRHKALPLFLYTTGFALTLAFGVVSVLGISVALPPLTVASSLGAVMRTISNYKKTKHLYKQFKLELMPSDQIMSEVDKKSKLNENERALLESYLKSPQSIIVACQSLRDKIIKDRDLSQEQKQKYIFALNQAVENLHQGHADQIEFPDNRYSSELQAITSKINSYQTEKQQLELFATDKKISKKILQNIAQNHRVQISLYACDISNETREKVIKLIAQEKITTKEIEDVYYRLANQQIDKSSDKVQRYQDNALILYLNDVIPNLEDNDVDTLQYFLNLPRHAVNKMESVYRLLGSANRQRFDQEIIKPFLNDPQINLSAILDKLATFDQEDNSIRKEIGNLTILLETANHYNQKINGVLNQINLDEDRKHKNICKICEYQKESLNTYFHQVRNQFETPDVKLTKLLEQQPSNNIAKRIDGYFKKKKHKSIETAVQESNTSSFGSDMAAVMHSLEEVKVQQQNLVEKLKQDFDTRTHNVNYVLKSASERNQFKKALARRKAKIGAAVVALGLSIVSTALLPLVFLPGTQPLIVGTTALSALAGGIAAVSLIDSIGIMRQEKRARNKVDIPKEEAADAVILETLNELNTRYGRTKEEPKAKICPEELTHYHFAYDSSDRTSGYFADLKQDIESAESHILINGWAVDNIRIGAKEKNADELDQRSMLSDILLKKSIQNPELMVLIQSWNHALDGDPSNQFGNALNKAARRYYRANKAEIKSSIKILKTQIKNEEDNEVRQGLKQQLTTLKGLRKGTLPVNLIWRANSGKQGDWVNSNHQKSVCIDGKIAYMGGIDLAQGRDVLPDDPIQEGTPIFRDGQTRVTNPQVIQSIENNAFALALSKTRENKTKITPNNQTQTREDINQYISQKINTIFNRRNNHKQSLPASKKGQNKATMQVIRTIPKDQLHLSSVRKNSVLTPDVKKELAQQISSKKVASIQEAYIEAIQNSKGFIYIENQNFTTKSISSGDNVPEAILMRILMAHKYHEDFHVYLTLPRYPVLETDDPNNMQVKFLATAQKDTIKELYNLLKQKGVEDPLKYLTISTQVKLESDKQAQVYNHSKFIMTDKTCIQGSANISDRSMKGMRDSEHAIRVEFNGDQEVKSKYKAYLKKMILSNMGEEFLGKLCDRNAELPIQRRFDGKLDFDPELLLQSPKFNTLWQQYLLYNQNLIENKQPCGQSIVPLAHDYFKGYLQSTLQNRKIANKTTPIGVHRKKTMTNLFENEKPLEENMHRVPSVPALKVAPKTPERIRRFTNKTTMHR